MQHACSKNLQAWQESRISRICRVCDLPSCVYCSWIESFFRSSDNNLPEQLVPSMYVMYCYFCLYAYNITSVSTPKSVIAKRKAKKPDPIIEIDDDSLYVLATNDSINGSQLYRSEVQTVAKPQPRKFGPKKKVASSESSYVSLISPWLQSLI
jgi:hypothetical protein